MTRCFGLIAIAGVVAATGCGRSDLTSATGSTDTDDPSTGSDSDDDDETESTTFDDTGTTTFPGTVTFPGTTTFPDTETFPDTTTTFPESSSSTFPETFGSSTTFPDTTGGFCGDGSLDFGEECDDGDFDDFDECLTDCQVAECGDGFQWLGNEECDDGNMNDNDECRNDCTLPTCPDGIVDDGEECDDGDFNDNDECLSSCLDASCGDGFEWTGMEQCDDGNMNNNDACRNDCTLPECGDGNLDAGEECDDGDLDDTDECLTTCDDAECGDGFLWNGMEECDDGDANGPGADCTPVCSVNECGDGFQHATDEECDPGAAMIGPGLMCRDGCILNVCGDGDEWLGVEECDDGNMNNNDACVNCNDAGCGDGFVDAGSEDCDDQNLDDHDRCHNDCSWHRVTQLALGGNTTCALFDSQLVKCWGNAAHGRSGAGNEINLGDDEPASAGDFIDVEDPVTQIIAGIGHTCVRHSDDSVRCFGRNVEGELGRGDTLNIGDNETPGSVGPIDLGAAITTFDSRSGAFHSCAWLSSDEARCWGRFENGRLGIPGQAEHIGDDEPASAGGPIDIGGTVTQFALGQLHTCALLEGAAGAVRCWGNGTDGALGYGNMSTIGDNEDPSAAGDVAVGDVVVQLSAGWFHTCARTDGGTVRCWGRGNNGRLGYGNTVTVGTMNTPSSVGDVSVGGVVTHVSAGLAHTCALLDDATVRCWGSGTSGALGYGNTDSIGDNELPSTAGAVNVGAPVVILEADGNHTCVVTDTGAVRCWGQGGEGRLGYGNTNFIGDDETPSSVGDVPLFP